MRRATFKLTTGALLGLTVVLTAGACGSGEQARFDDQAGERPLSCLKHQAAKPGTMYTGREKADTGQVLAVLRYYVANGNKPYCDGKPATENDAAWVKLYLDLGAEPARIARIRG